MPWCPNCGYEYRPEIGVCPDCGVELVTEPLGRRLARAPSYVGMSAFAHSIAVLCIACFAPVALYSAATAAKHEQSVLFNVAASLCVLVAWFWIGVLLRNFQPRILLLGLVIPAGFWLCTSVFGNNPHWRQLLFWALALPGTAAATMLCGMAFGRKPRAIYAFLPLLCAAVVAYLCGMLVQALTPKVLR